MYAKPIRVANGTVWEWGQTPSTGRARVAFSGKAEPGPGIARPPDGPWYALPHHGQTGMGAGIWIGGNLSAAAGPIVAG